MALRSLLFGTKTKGDIMAHMEQHEHFKKEKREHVGKKAHKGVHKLNLVGGSKVLSAYKKAEKKK